MTDPHYYDVEVSGNTFPHKDVIKTLGLRWNPTRQIWHGKHISRPALNALESLRGAKTAVLPIKVKDPVETALNVPEGLVPYDYQQKGAKFALENDHCLIADEMGLGKTIQALLACNTLPPPCKILVICPASLQINWHREAKKWCPGHPIFIMSYAIAHRKAELKSRWDVLILDESHYCKNSKTIRTKAVASVAKKSERIIALTGTPILNRPIEIYPLLKMCGHPLASNWERFVRTFCRGRKTIFGWDTSGFSNTDKLAHELKGFMIRRTKEEVLTQLPSKIRSLHILECSDYLKTLVDQEKSYVRESSKSLIDLRSEEIEEIKSLAKIRVAIATAKIGGVTEKILEILQEKSKLVVFFHHKGPLEAVKSNIEKEGYDCSKVTGDMKIEDRQKAVDGFQSGPVSVIFLTFGAGSEGLTLTAADTVLMAECDWTPARMMQAEDRCHRIGQKNSVHILYVVVEGSVDARIAQMAQEKGKRISEIIQGDLMQGI